ncbi:MAG: linear amide C-N hydrolase [Clostridia bacterium]|nr:linear amide C-N hydrolase [Clostridia bacterium]
MCTAVNLTGNFHFFGRNLDLHCDYGECAVKLPRGYALSFRHEGEIKAKYSALGCGFTVGGFPLYFDAMNSEGLCGAGLNFPRCAHYMTASRQHCNICSFELIPYVLSQCKDLREAADMLSRVNITDDSFSESYPATPLHWLFADKNGSIAVEPLDSGLSVTNAKTGVLTNSPRYILHETNLKMYPHLSPEAPTYPDAPLAIGTVSLPGGLTSEDRFVRASYFTSNCKKGSKDEERGSFISILSAVNVPRGSVITESGELHYTRYTSIYDTASQSLTYCSHGHVSPSTITLTSNGECASELEVVSFY